MDNFIAHIVTSLEPRPDVSVIEVNKEGQWSIQGGDTWYQANNFHGLSAQDSLVPIAVTADTVYISSSDEGDEEPSTKRQKPK